MLEPYVYQKECLERIDEARRAGRKKALVVMASGLGKTITVALDVKNWLLDRPRSKVLYLCHQNDILEQAENKFQFIIDGNSNLYGFYHGYEKTRRAQFLFASFQTLRSRLRKFGRSEFDYIIIDESHHTPAATYKPIVKYFQPKFLLGITATPDRMDMQDIRTLFGGDEIYSLTLVEALARKLITQVDYRLITDEIVELGKIENPHRMTLKELNYRIFVPRRDAEVAKIIRAKISEIDNPKMMIFCPSIAHAERLSKHIPGSLPVHSDLPNGEQTKRIQAFRNGAITTILTVDKFNEGVDIPEVNVVVFLRSTQSRTIFYQQLGRGLRKVSGKNKVLVLDFIANCERLLILHEFAEKVKEERHKRDPYDIEEIVIRGGAFTFTETAKNVLELLKQLQRGYTKEVLIEQLRNESKRLRRPPKRKDINQSSKEGKTASSNTFIRAFTTWNNALKAAGLKLHLKYYMKRELIQQLKEEYRRLKRSPTEKDMNRSSRDGRTACAVTFINAFVSWNNALKAAGLNPVQKRYTKIELIRQLRSEAKMFKKGLLVIRNIDQAAKEGRTASFNTFCYAFGTWNKALKAAKLI